MGVIPIIDKEDFFSCAFNENIFIPYSTKINYGDCSLMVERVVVVRKTRVRFSPFTLLREVGI